MKRYAEYKDSGIEWIGEIPRDWEIERLKDCTTVNDDVLSEKNDSEYLFRYVDIGSVTLQYGINQYQEMIFSEAPSRARRIVKSGDIIVSTVRTYLKAVAKIDDDNDVIVSTGFAVIRPRTISPRFLNYALVNNYFVETVASRSVGVSYPAINSSTMMNIKIPVAPIAIQQHIADYLDRKTTAIDSLIADKQNLVELLKEKRNAVISEAVTTGLDKTVKMKDSGIDWIGKIPEGWATGKTIYGLSMPITDGPHETPEFFDVGIPFISAEAIKNGKIDFNLKRGYISPSYYKECCKKYTPERDDIYMIKSGATTGNVAMVETDDIFTIWSPLAAFRCNERLLPKFLLYSLVSKGYQKQVENKWSFGTQQNIGMRVLESLRITYPPICEQRSIVAYLDRKTSQIDSLISDINEQIEKLKEYRQSVISEVVTGKVAV